MTFQSTICRLCLDECTLLRSHIIPEFLYAPLYDSKHRVPSLDVENDRSIRFLQKGLRERLLCERCESYLNTEYEQPFHKFWTLGSVLPDFLPHEPYNLAIKDYRRFRLFLLSILFRAGISSLNEFSEVQLGPYTEELRCQILNGDSGDPHRISIGALYLKRDPSNRNHHIIISPCKTRFLEFRSYAFTFGGCAWNFVLGSHSTKRLREVMLNPEGYLPMISIHYREMAYSSH